MHGLQVHLVDAHHCADAAKFISVLLVTLSTMVQLEMPQINLLSKVRPATTQPRPATRYPACNSATRCATVRTQLATVRAQPATVRAQPATVRAQPAAVRACRWTLSKRTGSWTSTWTFTPTS